MAANYWNEGDLERVIQTFNPANFFGLPSSVFTNKGDLRYCNEEPIKLTRGKWDYYTPFKGWIRYGLDVEKFGTSGSQWLTCDGTAGEWAVGFHGIRRDVLEILKCIAFEGFKVFEGKNSEWGATSKDIGSNAPLFNVKTCGKGIFLTPKMKHLTDNIENCRLIKPIQYNKHYYIEVVLQCRIHPRKIRVPECANNQYYIVNDPKHVRPYGLLIRFLTASQGKSILDDNNFNLEPAIPFITQDPNSLEQLMRFFKV
ncbi:unnamed protein product [Adineta steineri]|uniref:Uncharacterized protein n=1 Tax=Adineta steineri TaxID=433720 RepID=A0A815B8P6_9BILA|nr:unnamed protein product [Adineta steineri]CAF1265902.1 unnamed protein product [Adineta steineri]CAF4094840.1 unnamed protein product [Adineta steineri]CAF4108426.1 unnamed protein product [Adineta steineri]